MLYPSNPSHIQPHCSDRWFSMWRACYKDCWAWLEMPQCWAKEILKRPKVLSCSVLMLTFREAMDTCPTKSSSIWVDHTSGEIESRLKALSNSNSTITSPNKWYLGCSFHLHSSMPYAMFAHSLKRPVAMRPDLIKVSRSSSVSQSAQ